jgi:hypothetical protein
VPWTIPLINMLSDIRRHQYIRQVQLLLKKDKSVSTDLVSVAREHKTARLCHESHIMHTLPQLMILDMSHRVLCICIASGNRLYDGMSLYPSCCLRGGAWNKWHSCA